MSDLMAFGPEAFWVEPDSHVYFLKAEPSTQVDGQDATLPAPEVYGLHESLVMPVFSRYFQASPRIPPLQP